ncbi:manganese efflux pump MntP family protein [uncultured Clostridium sp.]|uniref:manganese efflux pump MntP n=1 Tax=uncultured Clostridium sp. TaxID=59620 RepID=UPI0025D3D31C|nr:manganese efflux pump MntP family protein [uncultured Clostridium sp.]
MGTLELVLIAVGLSMDAFAVAVCKGLNMKKIDYKQAIIIALFFGGFQGLMPLIGWILGKQFESYITSIDHWIAFGLLAFIGVQMIIEAIKGDDEEKEQSSEIKIKELIALAIATSIDALAVGITFAFLQASIIPSISLIAIITFILSIVGVVIGNKFGAKYKSKAELAGGVVLVLIGLKILLEHLGILF